MFGKKLSLFWETLRLEIVYAQVRVAIERYEKLKKADLIVIFAGKAFREILEKDPEYATRISDETRTIAAYRCRQWQKQKGLTMMDEKVPEFIQESKEIVLDAIEARRK